MREHRAARLLQPCVDRLEFVAIDLRGVDVPRLPHLAADAFRPVPVPRAHVGHPQSWPEAEGGDDPFGFRIERMGGRSDGEEERDGQNGRPAEVRAHQIRGTRGSQWPT